MAYKVGQVLFVVPTKGGARIMPVQVVEEIVKRSLQGGEFVTHMVKVGHDEDAKVVDITKIDGEIFDSSVLVKKILTERSTQAIAKIVDQAVNNALEWYNDAFEESTTENVLELKQELKQQIVEGDDNGVSAVLEDGTKVRIKLPESFRA